eukprot:5083576-Pleurochrysis_carterae.AAC.2
MRLPHAGDDAAASRVLHARNGALALLVSCAGSCGAAALRSSLSSRLLHYAQSPVLLSTALL